MKKKLSLILGAVALMGSLIVWVHAQESTNVNLIINGGTVTIGATGSFDFGSVGVSNVAVQMEQQFTWEDYFRVNDLLWSDSGYYTTISVTNLSGQSTSAYIPAANVAMKVDTTATTLITGTANANVVVDNTLLSYQSIDSVVTLINRTIGANNGVLGKYATFPWLRVTVPAYQQVDSYVGIITYTLYVN